MHPTARLNAARILAHFAAAIGDQEKDLDFVASELSTAYDAGWLSGMQDVASACKKLLTPASTRELMKALGADSVR